MSTSRIKFGDFVIDLAERRLTRDEAECPVRPKSFATLEHLVRNAGRLVTKQELLDALWPDTAVSEGVLKVCIREVREVLGDDAKQPRYIETRHRIGYRLIAPTRDDGPPCPTSSGGRSSGLFVGRAEQLGRLAELLAQVEQGAPGPRVVALTGEAGFGKTALADEFLRRTSSAGLLRCKSACVERHGIVEALFPFIEGLGELVGTDEWAEQAVRRSAPTWCTYLPSLFASDGRLHDETLGATRPRMLRELGAALRAISSERPLVWVLEDMHWADASSIDLLRHIGASCAHARLLMVVTLRCSAIAGAEHPLAGCLLELGAHTQATTIPLPPLSRCDITEYLELSLASDRVSDSLVTLIADRTEGHPLFLSSLVPHLRSIGGMRTGDDGRLEAALSSEALRREVPSDVRSMVERRLASLDSETRKVLTFASVLGAEPISDVLAELLEQPQSQVEDRLMIAFRVHQLLARPLELRGEGSTLALKCRFAHVLLRDALYEAIVPSRRVELHQRAGEILERRHRTALAAVAGQLAHHFGEGLEHNKAATYLVIVAENAERRLAYAEAEAACERALALLERLPPDQRPAVAIRCHRRRAGLCMASGRFAEAQAELAQMRSWAADSDNADAEVDAMMLTFRQYGYIGAFDAAHAIAEQAVRIAVERGLESRRVEIEADLASLRGLRGELGTATASLLLIVGRMVKPEGSTLLDLASYLSMQGRYAEALEHVDELLIRAKQAGDGLRFSAGLLWRGHALANLGRFTTAIASLEDGVRLTQSNEDRFILPRLLACMGWVHRELGAFERAGEWDRRALELSGQVMPDARAHALIDSALNQLGLAVNDHGASALDQAQALIAQPGFGDWLIRVRLVGARARRSLALGELEHAERFAAELTQLAVQHDLGKALARGRMLAAEVALRRGHPARCISACEGIIQTLEQRPIALIGWRVWMLLERAHRSAERHDQATRARAATEQAVARIMAETPNDLRSAFTSLTDRLHE